MTIRVPVADDHALVRAGFSLLVDNEPDMAVVGEAPTGAAAISLTRLKRPDVVLMDVRMPELDGPHRATLRPGRWTASLTGNATFSCSSARAGPTPRSARLHISVATAKTHVGRLLTKLGARDRAQLVIAAYESGLINGAHGR